MDRSIRDDDPWITGHCSEPELAKALPRWDRLAGTERARLEGHAAGCPRCGPALALLRRAEDWLVAQAPARPATPCPAAEDLYDFGQGPGARLLAPHRRAEIEEHLDHCVECDSFVATLASKPPSPIIVEEPAPEPAPAIAFPTAARRPARRRRPRSGRLRTLAAAAAVVALGFFAWNELETGAAHAATSIRYPAVGTLRGEGSERLLHPGGRVLPAVDGPRFGSGLVFELSEQVRGSSYRIEVDRQDGGAFDPGTPVFQLSAGTPLLRPSPEQLALLTEGDYTWEAWAQIDSLDVQLGKRDFHVEEAPGLARELRQIDDLPRFERESAQLQLLWDHGYLADARALARSFPDSAERDRFLEQAPAP